MPIDTKGAQQETLFPQTSQERQQMQEEHLDLLVSIAERTEELKQDAKRRRDEIAKLKKKADTIATTLRQSRPRMNR